MATKWSVSFRIWNSFFFSRTQSPLFDCLPTKIEERNSTEFSWITVRCWWCNTEIKSIFLLLVVCRIVRSLIYTKINKRPKSVADLSLIHVQIRHQVTTQTPCQLHREPAKRERNQANYRVRQVIRLKLNTVVKLRVDVVWVFIPLSFLCSCIHSVDSVRLRFWEKTLLLLILRFVWRSQQHTHSASYECEHCVNIVYKNFVSVVWEVRSRARSNSIFFLVRDSNYCFLRSSSWFTYGEYTLFQQFANGKNKYDSIIADPSFVHICMEQSYSTAKHKEEEKTATITTTAYWTGSRFENSNH